MWWCFAIGSAVFAALTSILAKIGIEGVNSTLGYGHSHGCGAGDELGHGVFYGNAKRHW